MAADVEKIRERAELAERNPMGIITQSMSAMDVPDLLALVDALTAERDALVKAATKYGRCCDLYQDSFREFACMDCQKKTFAMMREIQELIGVDKSCAALAVGKPEGK